MGPFANFLAATSFIVTFYYATKYKTQTKSLIIGAIAGTLVMTVVLSILNYFLLLPLYGMIMNLTDVVQNIKVIIVSGVVPFNLIKGLLVSLVFILLFKRLKNVLIRD